MRLPRSRAAISSFLARAREDFHLNPERYQRLIDYLLYTGVVAVLLLFAFILLRGS